MRSILFALLLGFLLLDLTGCTTTHLQRMEIDSPVAAHPIPLITSDTVHPLTASVWIQPQQSTFEMNDGTRLNVEEREIAQSVPGYHAPPYTGRNLIWRGPSFLAGGSLSYSITRNTSLGLSVRWSRNGTKTSIGGDLLFQGTTRGTRYLFSGGTFVSVQQLDAHGEYVRQVGGLFVSDHYDVFPIEHRGLIKALGGSGSMQTVWGGWFNIAVQAGISFNDVAHFAEKAPDDHTMDDRITLAMISFTPGIIFSISNNVAVFTGMHYSALSGYTSLWPFSLFTSDMAEKNMWAFRWTPVIQVQTSL